MLHLVFVFEHLVADFVLNSQSFTDVVGDEGVDTGWGNDVAGHGGSESSLGKRAPDEAVLSW